ncbi:lipoprotein-releasing ABC transporter permease subunit [Desulfohalovibrio reitneri]|uniref:lipoprotein-releasing ABC transporter permease subunit n=1 Tax=Desulfohalovibrio reitneri TaxID=1307759 RepID=UPI0004A6EC9C|nr:lipoprotein-releasing ABC transporter permease subunit [Desulfohalovibrio reitneri]
MRFELFVAFRYLLALRRQAFISLISLFAVFGVCLGVASLIVVIGVMNGFTHDLREKILGVNAHVLITSFEQGIADYEELVDRAEEVDGVEGAMPFVYSEVMLSTPRGVKGLALRGVLPDRAGGVLGLAGYMKAGEIKDLGREDGPPGVVVGAELASRLGLHLGSRVNLLSPTGRKTSAGFTPKISVFQVVGVFDTGMYEYDSSLGYVAMDKAQDLLGFDGDLATGVEVRTSDPERAEAISEDLRERIGEFPLSVRSWAEMNANLFAALKLEKTAMFIILALIIVVGSFSIVTTLVMLVMKKTRDVAVLMSMGAGRSTVRRIFMLQGTIIGAVGTVAGYLVGLPVAWLLRRYQFIELPRNVYPVDYLPVRLEAFDLGVIGVAAFLLCFLATIYPARRAASLNPADALRYE